MTRTTANATSADTSVLRTRARAAPAVERWPDSFSVMFTACCRRFISGAMPNNMPVTIETSSVNPRTPGSMRYLRRARDALRVRHDQRLQRGVAERCADRAADQRQEDPLGQELPQDRGASRAQRRADRKLALPRLGARQQQVRQIRTGDEQHEADGALQHPESAAHAADHVVLQAIEPAAGGSSDWERASSD